MIAHLIAPGCEVAVIGAGAMGSGIAQVAARAGHPVRLFDTRPDAVERAIVQIRAQFGRLVEKGRMTAAQRDAASARLQGAASLAELRGAALVVEAVVEDLAVKRSLFAQLEDVVDARCILASNTSSISITALAARLARPGRMVGMHFFNPAAVMELVEVVSGLATDEPVAVAVFDLVRAWGKQPVHARSTPGFIVNRVARPFYAEGLRLLLERAADVATLDALLREAGGFRMGPFELMDLIGHDVNLAVTRSVFEAFYGDPRFMPSIIQQELVDGGRLGRKSGRGFYDYTEGVAPPAAHSEAPAPVPAAVVLGGDPDAPDPTTARLLGRLEAAGTAITRHRLTPQGACGLHCGGAAIYLTDGRSATERAAADGHPDTVLFDLFADGATRIALARADQCSDAAYHAAVGLMQAAGFTVSRIDDVPGMVVMRTVAMLANEAADTVHQGVCSAQAVDLAMRKGVNYPQGPLAWAESIGLGQVATVLANLAASYGDGRYRVAQLLRRKVAAHGRFHERT
ncbi:MAG: 3-hydroxyacyl-CoA dehydrogenase PaaH [Gammaproteobacteria bacterium]